ncbi:hypothetical protein BD410DRAFT_781208 [Rickenella mellea]|uniref:Defect at low temperature protein 1 n=1 Tax=Rickenella mellea TaxID=50990 RepID=A0A4Y7QLZ5_9AGAM|nr:hypothetical protein BD410DRAFT_781208 [Rickenella mellea]
MPVSAIARFGYLALVLLTFVVVGLSCIGLLSQAIRTSPDRDWNANVNAVVVGGAYVLILAFSLGFCLKRRISVRRRLAKIPKSRIAVRKGDVPQPVQEYIEREFLRSCAVAYKSQPKATFREGWGAPGTKYEGIRFRTAVLDTIPEVDAVARLIIPSMPAYRTNVPITRHLRHIKSLISADDDGDAYFRNYTNVVQVARYASREPTEEEFGACIDAAAAIKQILLHYRMAQMDASNPELNRQS